MSNKWCALSVRRIKDGKWNEFRQGWDAREQGGDHPPFIKQIFHVRNVEDPNLVISWGLAEGDKNEIQSFMQQPEWRGLDERRHAAMAPWVEETLVDGIFEVVEEIVPAHA
jgi:hypothetical protein